MNFGKKIKMLRIKKGLNQKQLAIKVGISASYLCDLEKGRVTGSIRVLQSICDVLEVDFADLLK